MMSRYDSLDARTEIGTIHNSKGNTGERLYVRNFEGFNI